MEPAQWLWALFYVWLLVALGVWLWRGYRRFAKHETRKDREARRMAERGTADAVPGAGSPVVPGAPARSDPAAVPVAGTDEQLPEGSLVREAIRAELEERRQREQAAAGTAAPTAADAPADPLAAAGSGEVGDDRRGVFARQAPTHRPVADAVAGIVMPCGLVPLVTGTTVDPRHVVFATSDHDAGTVGAALADELERLGFTVRSLTDTEAVAVKPDAEVRVTVHPAARRAEADGVPRFPTAPPASVVVELAT
jgi:hypothetical protein